MSSLRSATLPVPLEAVSKPPRRTGLAAVAPALALLALFFVLPVTMLLLRSLLEPAPGLQNYAELFGSTTYLRVLINTFAVAGLVTLVTLLIGFPVAWFLAIAPRAWSNVLFGILILSM